jgi:hypothetical protein
MGMLNKAKIRFYTQMGNSSTTRRYFEMYNMMGDGAIDVYSDIPAQLVVSYPAVIPLGIYQIPITVTKNGSPVRNALVCAMGKNDTSIQVSAYTNSSGQVVLPVTTSAPDSVYITVTGHNLAPHLGGVVPIPPGPYVMYMRHLILDPAPGGNNDSIINPGEAVEMRVWFRNYGNSTANNVQVWLRTTDSHITITDSFKTIGNIPSNDSGYTANGFHFTVAVSCTNAYNLNFTLAIRDAADSSWRSTLSIPVAQCVLQHESTLVNDPAPGGNNNGIINRGETVNLITTISNIGGANANNVLAILSTNTPHVTITDPTSNFGLITINSSGNNASDPFTVSVDSSITPGSMIQFKVVMTSGVYVDSFQFTLPVEIYMEDFEATNGSYIPNPLTGGWAWGIPSSGPGSAHSGTKCWATVLAGNYKNSANWTLTSPVFTASGNNPQLKFWHWYYMDSSYDGGNVKISTNNGSTWTVVTPVGGYNGTAPSSNAGIPNQPCYMGQSNGWLEATFNLPVTAGQQFLLRWHFGSDASVVYAGWYIDDITGIGFTNILSGISEVSQSINHLTTMLYAPKPNPVINGLARISFSLAEPTRVSLKIYDASGRIVKTLVNGQVVRGIYNLTWDGRDDNHRSVADGIYFYTLETSKQNFTKKMVYTR